MTATDFKKKKIRNTMAVVKKLSYIILDAGQVRDGSETRAPPHCVPMSPQALCSSALRKPGSA